MAKEKANNGYIKLYRSMKEWRHYGDSTAKAVFLELLLSVNHKDGLYRGAVCERGATFISIRGMAENLKMSTATVLAALRKLERTGEISRTRVSQNLVKTTITNFENIQSGVSMSDTPSVSVNDTPSAKGVSIANTPSVSIADTPSAKGVSIIDTEQEYIEEEYYKKSSTRARTREEKNFSFFEELKKHPRLIEIFVMNERTTVERYWELAGAVLNEWEMQQKEHEDYQDFVKHLNSTIRIKLQIDRRNGKNWNSIDKKERERAERGAAVAERIAANISAGAASEGQGVGRDGASNPLEYFDSAAVD